MVVAGHYRVLARIGSGAMGVVWQARDERLDRLVAIKQLLLQPGATEGESENARKRAMREARIAAMLQHPNAVTIYDVVELDGDPCLVMEYVPARSLADLLDERGYLEPAETAGIGSQIASALAAAHAKGIVHRDVKPGNLLLGESGTAKITDFGISRAVGDMTLTQTGIVAGTPAYFSPEVARGQDPTPVADVFSLGSTLYAAVEGEPPFGNAQNPLAVLHAVAAGEVELPRHAGQLTALLMRMLRKDPGERPTMARTQRDLAAVASGVAQSTDAARTPSPAVGAMALAPQNPPPAEPEPPRGAITPAMNAGPPAAPWPAEPRPAAAPRPEAGRRAEHPSRRRWMRPLPLALVIGTIVVVGALVATLLLTGDGGSGSGGGDKVAAPPSASRHSESHSPTAPPEAKPEGGPIDWSSAGQLAIDFYSGLDKPDKAWAMLSQHARAVYGSKQDFVAYWKKLLPISARDANGVAPNPDGSVAVPVTVVFGYGPDSHTKDTKLRVTRLDGSLKIDSDTRSHP